ncbi:MAG: NusG domain II-containing protein [Bacillota bacterium]|nr:NusG domain II-containing protein [Bacillota bacterium]
MRFKVGDIIIIAIVLFSALFTAIAFRPHQGDSYAEILINGKKVEDIQLTGASDSEKKVEYGDLSFDISIKDQKIAIVHIKCPNQICVKTGYIGQVGQVIACVPNHIIIKIVNKSGDGEVDAVVK